MNIKLSIITINFNNADGLQKTMDSVFCQSSHEFEYIVIDGGSTDGSKELISQYANKYKSITFTWVSEADNGIYHAMNKGIKMAKGEFLQFLNSGDYLIASDVTEKMLGQQIDCGIFYGNKIKIFPDGRKLYNKEIPSISMLTFYLGTLNHASAYIKKSLFSKYGMYDESYKIVSDWKFYLIAIVLNNEKVKYVDIDVVCFDMIGISNTNSILIKEERTKVLKEMLPARILADYDKYWIDIDQMKRLKRYSILRWFLYIIDRIIFKIDKYNTKRKKEHIFL